MNFFGSMNLNTSIMYNQFGEMSLVGWLYYLDLHASLESIRIY